MEPDAAALALCMSPYHLAIPRAFYSPIMRSVRRVPLGSKRRIKGVSPYGLSSQCLLSTDSLVPLLPIRDSLGRPLHVFGPVGSDESLLIMEPTQSVQGPRDEDSNKLSSSSGMTPCIQCASADVTCEPTGEDTDKFQACKAGGIECGNIQFSLPPASGVDTTEPSVQPTFRASPKLSATLASPSASAGSLISPTPDLRQLSRLRSAAGEERRASSTTTSIHQFPSSPRLGTSIVPNTSAAVNYRPSLRPVAIPKSPGKGESTAIELVELPTPLAPNIGNASGVIRKRTVEKRGKTGQAQPSIALQPENFHTKESTRGNSQKDSTSGDSRKDSTSANNQDNSTRERVWKASTRSDSLVVNLRMDPSKDQHNLSLRTRQNPLPPISPTCKEAFDSDQRFYMTSNASSGSESKGSKSEGVVVDGGERSEVSSTIAGPARGCEAKDDSVRPTKRAAPLVYEPQGHKLGIFRPDSTVIRDQTKSAFRPIVGEIDPQKVKETESRGP